MLNVAVAIILNNLGQVLITKRSASASYASKWEFPGGKLELGETARQALKRELKEELDIECENIKPWLTTKYRYPDCHVCLHVFFVRKYIGTAKCLESQQAMAWINKKDLNNYQFPAGNMQLIDKLQKISEM